ncbi:MAG: protein kinase, partial [Deltaproteobacteria bacterium]|nr:protein kinase [Deltaproteobacteria bacterium]
MPETGAGSPGGVPPLPDVGPGFAGRQLGHYAIHEELGRGGMSVVYRGRDTRLDREVAIKVLHPFLADRADARQRFEREARAVARLHHPNILEIYDFSNGETDQSYIVTELVRGETLRAYAERVGIDPPEIAALIGIEICKALEQAHALGIVHRDVKPENVMLDHSGAVKLMDFGIAHMRDQGNLTVTGTLLGSPAHMAPEAIDGAAIDERADQFSLGTILYWLATGKLPFVGKNPHALLKKIVEGRFTPPQRVNPKVSDAFASVICRTLASDPGQRFGQIVELREALAAIARDAAIAEVGETLRRYTCETAPTRAALTRSAVEAFGQRARDLQKRGEIAQALAAINQVLALDPDNTGARREIVNLTRRMQRIALKRRLLRGSTLAGMGAVIVVALVWAWSSLYPTPAPSAAPAPPAQVEAPPPATPLETSAVDPAQVAGAVDTPTVDEAAPAMALQPQPAEPGLTGKKRAPSALARTGAVPALVQPTAGATPGGADVETEVGPPATSAVARELTVRVDPWADIYVDDVLKVRGSNVATLRLTTGSHLLRFENRFTAPVTRTLEVTADGPLPALAVKLVQMKPSYLVVESTPDGEVKVAGEYKGKASESRRSPIFVPMPNYTRELSLTVEVSRD